MPGTEAAQVELAVIGCGSIAQLMHLPNVREHPDAALGAICEQSTAVREAVADQYHVDRCYESVAAFLDAERGRVDGVLVCTPSHARIETALPVLEAGVPALIEKPLATVPADAAALAAAAESSVAMVGYMKRYHPTVVSALDTIPAREDVDHVRIYDVDPDHGQLIRELHPPVAGGPPGPPPERRLDQIAAALDTESDRFVEAYSFQIEHVCHDLNLLRAALGQVTAVDYADVFNDARYLTANLRYGDLRCSLESGVSARNWFEEYLRVDTPESRLRLEFDNPFKRHAPPRFEHTAGETTFERTTRQDSQQDSFRLELDHFVRCLRGEATPRTSLDEAAADVSLLVEIFEAAIAADQAAST